MRLHSTVGLVTNSSSEVFTGSIAAAQEDVPGIINAMWKLWRKANDDSFYENLDELSDVAQYFDFSLVEDRETLAKDHYDKALYYFLEAYYSGTTQDTNIDPGLMATLEQTAPVMLRAEGKEPNEWMVRSWIHKNLVDTYGLEEGSQLLGVMGFASLVGKGTGYQWRNFLYHIRSAQDLARSADPVYSGSCSNHDVPQDFIVLVYELFSLHHMYNG